MKDAKELKYSNLIIGQIFKNYKELCEFLDKPVKGGKSKVYQLEEFKRHFSWIKEGNKFIIDDVYDVPQKKDISSLWKNNKNVQPMILYFLNHFSRAYPHEYCTYSRTYSNILHIFNNEYYNDLLIVAKGENDEDFATRFDVHFTDDELKIVRLYIPVVRHILQDLIQKTIRFLVKQNIITITEGYSFIYHSNNYMLSIGTSALNEYIEQMETDVCRELLDTDQRFEKYKHIVKGNGRQLKYYLHSQNQGELLSVYNELRMNHLYYDDLGDDETPIDILNIEIDCDALEHPFVKADGSISERPPSHIGDKISNQLDDYYKAFKINSLQLDLYEFSKEENIQDVLETVIKIAARMVFNHKETKEEYSDYGNVFYVKHEPYRNNKTVKILNRVNKQLFWTKPNYIIPEFSQEEIQEQINKKKEDQLDSYIHDFATQKIKHCVEKSQKTNDYYDEFCKKRDAQIAEYEALADWDALIDYMMM